MLTKSTIKSLWGQNIKIYQKLNLAQTLRLFSVGSGKNGYRTESDTFGPL
jgi:hypothetical protein